MKKISITFLAIFSISSVQAENLEGNPCDNPGEFISSNDGSEHFCGSSYTLSTIYNAPMKQAKSTLAVHDGQNHASLAVIQNYLRTLVVEQTRTNVNLNTISARLR